MSTLKVLFFAADPLSIDGHRRRLLLDKEAREIKEEMAAASKRDLVEFVPCPATRITDLRRELLRHRPQIVHFSGHGGSEGLVLEGEDGRPHRVDAEALKEFFAAFRGRIRVVVLNACHSRPQAEAIRDAVGCAIGTPDKILDDAAISFSASFYSSIAFGESVNDAFVQARATIGMKAFPRNEAPELLVRDDVDASQLVLIADLQPSSLPAPITSAATDPVVTSVPVDPAPRFALTPPVTVPQPPMRRRVAWGAGALALCGVSLALWAVVPPTDGACDPVREVQRAIQEAGPAPMGLLSAPSPASGDPTADPPELEEAKKLHAEGDHAADLPLLEKAAEADNAEAMVLLGRAYINGEGIAPQPEVGIDWLRKAARTADPSAMNELGEAYLRREGVDRRYFSIAADWFQKAADKGHAEAMRNLAHMYRDGRGVAASGTTALEWYAKAAKAGSVDAMVDAGAMYERGGVIPRSATQAFCWYRAAAELGLPRGMREQGRILESRGKRDEAAELYERARQAEASSPAGRRPAR